jgi:hypothetical protein
MAELAALSETTAGRAEELRALELERCDQMVAYGRWVLALAESSPFGMPLCGLTLSPVRVC